MHNAFGEGAGMPAGGPAMAGGPTGYQPAQMMAAQAMGRPGMVYQSVAPSPGAMVYGPMSGHLIVVLRQSMLPSEREMAAEQLARCDWRSEPHTVQALLQAAKADPAPAVRAGCVRALAKMKANAQPVVQAVKELKSDQDLRVRQEVEQALAVLTAAK
jgi:hypothetical protein